MYDIEKLTSTKSLTWNKNSLQKKAVRRAIKDMAKGEVLIVGAFEKELNLGFCGLDFRVYSDGGYLWMLEVAPEHRRKGVGEALVFHLEEEEERRGLVYSYLAVEKKNEIAMALYEKLGYLVIKEEIQQWPEKNSQGETFMYRTECWVLRKKLVRV